MKKIFTYTIVSVISIFIFLSTAKSEYNQDIIDKIKLSQQDLPAGFVFGKIPRIHKKILKENPWTMDTAAMTKLADKIYPSGDASKILRIHMAIIANEKRPYNDDLVCYMFLYRNRQSAQSEIKKLERFAENNQDRLKLVTKQNIAILIFSGNNKNFSHVKNIATNFKERLNKI